MHAALAPMNSLAETFREPDHAYLSPRRVGGALGLQIQSLAERAQVSRNTPATRPQNEHLSTISVRSCVSWLQPRTPRKATVTAPSSGS
jgi:hypothetical protein